MFYYWKIFAVPTPGVLDVRYKQRATGAFLNQDFERFWPWCDLAVQRRRCGAQGGART